MKISLRRGRIEVESPGERAAGRLALSQLAKDQAADHMRLGVLGMAFEEAIHMGEGLLLAAEMPQGVDEVEGRGDELGPPGEDAQIDLHRFLVALRLLQGIGEVVLGLGIVRLARERPAEALQGFRRPPELGQDGAEVVVGPRVARVEGQRSRDQALRLGEPPLLRPYDAEEVQRIEALRPAGEDLPIDAFGRGKVAPLMGRHGLLQGIGFELLHPHSGPGWPRERDNGPKPGWMQSFANRIAARPRAPAGAAPWLALARRHAQFRAIFVPNLAAEERRNTA